MAAGGHAIAVPRNEDPELVTRPLLDFAAGYVLRSADAFPRQGSRPPWEQSMRYSHDARVLRHEPVDEGVMHFVPRGPGVGASGGDEARARPSPIAL